VPHNALYAPAVTSDPKAKLPGMSTGAEIAITILVVYTAACAVFAFNLWRLSDRAASLFIGKPWWYRAFARDKPEAWKAGGVIGLAFGVVILGWIVVIALR
jgi:hypothetical protein